MITVSNLQRALELHKAGRLDEAEQIYREILESRPDAADVLHYLGMIAAQRGQFGIAVQLIERAIRLDPTVAVYHSNLGEAHRARGELHAAADAYRRALDLRFDNDTLDALARVLYAQGPVEQAVEAYLRALASRPEDTRARRGLAALLRTIRPTGSWPELERELAACYRSGEIDPSSIAGITANQLKHRQDFPERLPLSESDVSGFVEAYSDDPLLLALLTRSVNVDYALERILTDLRRHFLLDYRRDGRIPNERIPLIAALAQQCFNNEHVFDVDADEAPAVEALAGDLCAASGRVTGADAGEVEGRLALLACYLSPASLACASDLVNLDMARWSPMSRELVQRTLVEPLQEREIEAGIESLGAIEDPTSKAVQAQYEESPYPRWVGIGRLEASDLRSVLSTRFPGFQLPSFLDGHERILIAGCGTGKEPIGFALMYPHSQVLAVDLSRSSLAYATRVARELGVTNVRFLQADILNLGQLEDRFHVISSAGVLHHMADPLAGWRVLAERLVPSGIMQVNLYSECAREPLAAAREEIRRRGLRPVAEDIREFRGLVLSGESGGIPSEFLSGIDFYTMSNCRDLLFHVQEHRFTLAQIGEALDALGLRLIGFDPGNLHVPQGAHAEFLHDGDLGDFDVWARLEKRYPRAFLSMYRFWCQKP